MPNERWQADTTHWQLADGTGVEILNILDDHSRLDLLSKATAHHHRPRRPGQLPRRVPPLRHPRQRAHRQRRRLHRQAPPRRPGRPRDRARPPRRPARTTPGPTTPRPAARSSASTRPRRSGSPPSHPPPPSPSCNASSTGSAATTTPSDPTAPSAAAPPPRPTPPGPRPHRPNPSIPVHYRVRRDKVDTSGVITLRYDSQLRHIGLGREHARNRVLALVADLLHPRRRRRDRRTPPRTRPRPHPRLPTTRPPTRTHHRRALKCNDVPRHLSTVSRDITVAPRVGVEPTSLILIQSQAGPAGRPIGECGAKPKARHSDYARRRGPARDAARPADARQVRQGRAPDEATTPSSPSGTASAASSSATATRWS